MKGASHEVTSPKEPENRHYMMRRNIMALHPADRKFYTSCIQLRVKGW